MTTFDDRETAFEAHFAFEEELEFKVRTRRDRLVAQWAGGLMGLSGEALEAYCREVVHADLADRAGEELYRKVLVDLAHRDVHVQPHAVREEVERATLQARESLGSDAHADEVGAPGPTAA